MTDVQVSIDRSELSNRMLEPRMAKLMKEGRRTAEIRIKNSTHAQQNNSDSDRRHRVSSKEDDQKVRQSVQSWLSHKYKQQKEEAVFAQGQRSYLDLVRASRQREGSESSKERQRKTSE
eukprot:CAMPEP_0185589370 /NCGR_PEP_ID=MMETSP0434-20130131/56792_1 /TAXON_ID=626734 ORGANISM="Favella taraikaensis, Strain Fe Narragansett Bay" /NCGR_SAMPLE_ID=MMETSP0434 /ASSEMBLY_ACC=CAM_ASM_000379 /LENGTH=118 /DNA_ID=CAMNT_0028212721 /DNA_START=143 /DNA_END=499 /DNA_ORIENTATION=+